MRASSYEGAGRFRIAEAPVPAAGRVDEPGGMQEYWTVATDRLLRVPATLSDDQAALIEPLAVATHDVRRAEVKAGDRVVVFGGGPIGVLIAMVARHRDA